jgi:hypothetical protein
MLVKRIGQRLTDTLPARQNMETSQLEMALA